jgi:hypothetical protein
VKGIERSLAGQYSTRSRCEPFSRYPPRYPELTDNPVSGFRADVDADRDAAFSSCRGPHVHRRRRSRRPRLNLALGETSSTSAFGSGGSSWGHAVLQDVQRDRRTPVPDLDELYCCSIQYPTRPICAAITFAIPTARVRTTCPAGCVNSGHGSEPIVAGLVRLSCACLRRLRRLPRFGRMSCSLPASSSSPACRWAVMACGAGFGMDAMARC